VPGLLVWAAAHYTQRVSAGPGAAPDDARTVPAATDRASDAGWTR